MLLSPFFVPLGMGKGRNKEEETSLQKLIFLPDSKSMTILLTITEAILLLIGTWCFEIISVTAARSRIHSSVPPTIWHTMMWNTPDNSLSAEWTMGHYLRSETQYLVFACNFENNAFSYFFFNPIIKFCSEKAVGEIRETWKLTMEK